MITRTSDNIDLLDGTNGEIVSVERPEFSHTLKALKERGSPLNFLELVELRTKVEKEHPAWNPLLTISSVWQYNNEDPSNNETYIIHNESPATNPEFLRRVLKPVDPVIIGGVKTRYLAPRTMEGFGDLGQEPDVRPGFDAKLVTKLNGFVRPQFGFLALEEALEDPYALAIFSGRKELMKDYWDVGKHVAIGGEFPTRTPFSGFAFIVGAGNYIGTNSMKYSASAYILRKK